MYRVQKFICSSAKKSLFAGALIAASTAIAAPVLAEAPDGITRTTNKVAVKVSINQVTLVKLKDRIADALIGNPAIADITMQSDSSFVITGKSYGRTNIILLNKSGEPIFNRTVSVDDEKQNIVRLQRGAARVSYTCAPNCQPTPTIGDDRMHMKTVSENYQDKLKEVGQAMAISSQGN